MERRERHAEDRDALSAEARGRERGAEFLHWLRSEVEARPIAPLEAFRFAFDERPDALHAAAKAEAEVAAAVRAHAHATIGAAAESTAAVAARQRRVAANLASPPPNLSAFAGRMWTAFCEADVDSCDALTRVQFEAALASLQLSAPPAEAAARWRAAGRDLHSGRLTWIEFKRLVSQYKSLADAATRRAEQTQTATRTAAERVAAARIQASARGNLTRKQMLHQKKEAQRREREALVKVRAAEVYAGSAGDGSMGNYQLGRCSSALCGSRRGSDNPPCGNGIGGLSSAYKFQPALPSSRPPSRTMSRPSSLPTSPLGSPNRHAPAAFAEAHPAVGSGGRHSTVAHHSWPVLAAEPPPLSEPQMAAQAAAAAHQRALEADGERRRLEEAHRQQQSDMATMRLKTVELMSELDAERAR